MTSLAQTIAKSMTQHDCPKENRAEKSEILLKIGLLEVIFKLTEPLNIDNLLFKKIVYKINAFNSLSVGPGFQHSRKSFKHKIV